MRAAGEPASIGCACGCCGSEFSPLFFCSSSADELTELLTNDVDEDADMDLVFTLYGAPLASSNPC